MDNYKQISEDYELLNSKEEIFQQKEFFKEIIKKYKVKNCLDCACGLGWHLDLINDLGVKVFGSDLSKSMVEICKENLKEKEIEIKTSDYRNLRKTWSKKFDLIICMTSALNHMQNDTEILEALKSMKEVLSDRGVIIIASGVSDALSLSRPKFIPVKELPSKGVYFFLEYNKDKVDFNILNIKKSKENLTHNFNTMNLSIIGIERLKKCSSNVNLTISEIYGDFEFRKYDKDDLRKRLVVILKEKNH